MYTATIALWLSYSNTTLKDVILNHSQEKHPQIQVVKQELRQTTKRFTTSLW